MNAEYVLGNLMQFSKDDPRLVNALSTIKPEFFLKERHLQIFNGIKQCFENGLNPDPVTLSEKLKCIELQQFESWLEILFNLKKNSPSAANFEHSLENLKAEWNSRYANTLLEQAILDLNDANNPDLQGRIKNAVQRVSEIEYDDVNNKSWFSMTDTISGIFDDMVLAAQRGENFSGITTGFPQLDEQIDGLQAGETYVLAGSPGSGKTTLAVNICVANLLDNKRVLFYSLEMPHKQIGKKLMSCAGNLEQWVLKNDKYVKSENKTRLDMAFAQIADKNIIIDEGFDLTAENMDITTKKHEMRMGGVDLILVDYLTLMQAQGESETVKASNAAKACKRIAKKFECPVIILAQLVKNVVGKPKKSDLKQTGQLEQDASAIFLLYNDPEYVQVCIDLEVAKNRFGETGDLYFDPDFARNKFIQRPEPPARNKPEEEKPRERVSMRGTA